MIVLYNEVGLKNKSNLEEKQTVNVSTSVPKNFKNPTQNYRQVLA